MADPAYTKRSVLKLLSRPSSNILVSRVGTTLTRVTFSSFMAWRNSSIWKWSISTSLFPRQRLIRAEKPDRWNRLAEVWYTPFSGQPEAVL